jgi:hypothetical protein
LLAQIIGEQSILDLIDSPVGFVSDLLETNPDQDSTANMITDKPGFPALAAFDPGQLFGLGVKLLGLPTQAAHFLDDLRFVLSQVVRHDIVCALGRQHHPEEFHLISGQMAVGCIMAELLGRIGKVRQKIIDLADQQLLAVFQAADRVAFGSHHFLPIHFRLPCQSILFCSSSA